MVSGGGSRVQWAQLPVAVRSGVASVLGSAVIEAVSQPGGFSPGSADRVVTADGRRAFVKAVGAQINPQSATMHRTEAATAAVLPVGLPTPAFVGAVEVAGWVALCFDDVVGRHPRTPWELSEICSTLDTLAALAGADMTGVVLPNPPAGEAVRDDFAGWERIVADPPAVLPPFAAAHLSELRGWAAAGVRAVEGRSLCHFDIRADNLLIDDAGRVLVVDWPWATVGAPWIDAVSLLINVGLFGGHDLEALLATSPQLRDAPPDDVTAFLAGLAGMFVDSGRCPDSPGLPTLRQFQRRQGDVVLTWLAQRLGW